MQSCLMSKETQDPCLSATERGVVASVRTEQATKLFVYVSRPAHAEVRTTRNLCFDSLTKPGVQTTPEWKQEREEEEV